MTGDLDRRLREEPTGDPRYRTGRLRAMLLEPGASAGRVAVRRGSRIRIAGNGLRLAVTVLVAALVVAGLLLVRGSKPPDNTVIASPSPAPSAAPPTASPPTTPSPTPTVAATASPTPPLSPTIAANADRLARVQAAGVIRIAVRPTQPEYHTPGARITFDQAIATELAKRLGVSVQLVQLSTADMVADASGAAWDLALPSTAAWAIPAATFAASEPYYYWPHYLLATRGAQNAETDAQIAAGPVCGVTGDLGEAWLRGMYGTTPGAPVTRQVVTRPTEPECFGLVKAGSALAAVTAFETYVGSNCAFTGCTNGSCKGGQPCPAEMVLYREVPPEPRAAIVPRAGPSGDSLLAAVNRAIDAMRADHTLSTFSTQQFGPGRDVSVEKNTGAG